MRRRVASRSLAAATLLACLCAHAGSLVVHDDDGGRWIVVDDPAPDANDYLLKHQGPANAVDARFGRAGQSAFALTAGNDTPASMRVDATRRVWMVAAGLIGNQSQPVVARFLADGSLDPHWGVQGKIQLSPNALPVRPNDLLPLADGSVLVAGVDATRVTPRAVVFHLNADGTLDRHFGNAGLWQRAGDADASSATSLAAAADGSVTLAIAVRGAKPAAELWAVTAVAPALLTRQPLADDTDGEDLRTEWVGDRWALNNSGGPTTLVPAASLTARAQDGAAIASVAASDPGEGGFNPFEADPASAAAAAPADANGGTSWGWIAAGALLLGAIAVVLLRRRRQAPASSGAARR